MRWLKEFFRPALKCQRVGHKMALEPGYILKRGDAGLGKLLVRYSCDIPTCKRCGLTEQPEHLIETNYYSTASLPRSKWDELRENGFMLD